MKKIKNNRKFRQFISVIILASGASKRFEGCKYIEPIDGIPLIYWSLKPFIELYLKCNVTITIVVGPYYNTIFELLDNSKEPFFNKTIRLIEQNQLSKKTRFSEEIRLNDEIQLNDKNKIFKNKKFSTYFSSDDSNFININICKNEDYEKGMFSSYKKGLNTIYKLFDNKKYFTKLNRAIIISLADMPLISSDIVLKLVSKLDSKFVDYSVPYFMDLNKDPLNCKDSIKNKDALNLKDLLNLIGEKYNKFQKGKKGHPIALKPSFALRIFKFDDKIILRDAIKIGKSKLVKTKDKGVLFDVDFKDDIRIVEAIIKGKAIYKVL